MNTINKAWTELFNAIHELNPHDPCCTVEWQWFCMIDRMHMHSTHTVVGSLHSLAELTDMPTPTEMPDITDPALLPVLFKAAMTMGQV